MAGLAGGANGEPRAVFYFAHSLFDQLLPYGWHVSSEDKPIELVAAGFLPRPWILLTADCAELDQDLCSDAIKAE